MLDKYGMANSKAMETPTAGNELPPKSLDTVYLDKADTKTYQKMVESLMYLVQCARYEIAFSVHALVRLL